MKEFLNLKTAQHYQTKNYFNHKSFQFSKSKEAPNRILKTYIFNMGREGIKSSREFDSILTALSLIGGFVTIMYRATYYLYKYITQPTTELKLAYAFEKIVQRNKKYNNLKKSTKYDEEEVEALRSCCFRI